MSLSTVTQTGGPSARDEVRQLVNQLALLTANRGLTAAGTARGTTAQKAKTVNNYTFMIDGAFKSLSATDDFWTLSGTTVAVSSWQKYFLCVDASGTASIIEGVQSTTSAAAVVLPNLPQAKSVVAILTVATDATHTFVPGTTALNGTGITATFADGYDGTSLYVVSL